jgi:hypothetical protein
LDTPPRLWRHGVPGHGHFLAGYETVYDLAVLHGDVAALHEGSTAGHMLEWGPFEGRLTGREVTSDAGRVGLTSQRVFIGSHSGSLETLDDETRFEGVIDFACAADAALVSLGDTLLVLTGDGRVDDEIAPGIGEVSAVDVDSVAGGWLLGSARGVFHLHEGALGQLAPALEGAPRKVRRGERAVWARVGNALIRATPGATETKRDLSSNAWYWDDFDANVHGAVLLDVYNSGGLISLDEAEGDLG